MTQEYRVWVICEGALDEDETFDDESERDERADAIVEELKKDNVYNVEVWTANVTEGCSVGEWAGEEGTKVYERGPDPFSDYDLKSIDKKQLAELVSKLADIAEEQFDLGYLTAMETLLRGIDKHHEMCESCPFYDEMDVPGDEGYGTMAQPYCRLAKCWKVIAIIP